MNRLQTDKKYLHIAQSEVIEASSHVQVPVSNIEILFPPRVDDMVHYDRVMWKASVGPVNMKIDGNTSFIGGAFSYEEPPKYEDFRIAIRRSALYACILETVPAKSFIYQAEYLYSGFNGVPDITQAGFMNAVVTTIGETVKDLDKKLREDHTYDPKHKPMMSLNAAFRVVGDQLQAMSLEPLKEIYNRMGEERAKIIRYHKEEKHQ